MSQTSVSQSGQSVAVAGQLVDNQEGEDIVSRFSQEASAEIPFGAGVQFGTVRDGVKLLTSSGVIEGVSVWGFNHQPGTNGDLGTTGLKPKAGLQVIRRGRVYVLLDKTISVAIVPSDRGFCRYTIDGVTNPTIGAWSNASDAGKNLDCTKQVEFLSAAFLSADGTNYIAEADVAFVNKP